MQVNTSSTFDRTSVFDSELGDVTSQEVRPFSSGTTYYWPGKADTDAGWGDWSSTRSVIASEVP